MHLSKAFLNVLFECHMQKFKVLFFDDLKPTHEVDVTVVGILKFNVYLLGKIRVLDLATSTL